MTAYTSIEAFVKEGKIYPLDPDNLPREGELLLFVPNAENVQADPQKIRDPLGWLNAVKTEGSDGASNRPEHLKESRERTCFAGKGPSRDLR